MFGKGGGTVDPIDSTALLPSFNAVPQITNFGFQVAKGAVTEDFVSFLGAHSLSMDRRECEGGILEQSFVVHEDDAIPVLKEHGKSLREGLKNLPFST